MELHTRTLSQSERPLHPLRAVLFDDAGVLVQHNWHEVDGYGRSFGLPWCALARLLFHTQAWHDYQAWKVTRDVWLNDARRSLRRYWGGCTDARLMAFLERPIEPHLGTWRIAAAVKAAGAKVAVVSNGDSDAIEAVRHGFGVDVDWDDVVVAAAVGASKPDPEIYRIAAARLGVLPEECLVVDDSAQNVAAARCLGMGAYLFDDRPGRLLAHLYRAGLEWTPDCPSLPPAA